MNLFVLLASAILLQPVLADATEMRLAATDTGGEDVTWYLDGNAVAITASGEAAVVSMPAGEHEVWVTTAHDGPWRAVVRPVEGTGAGDLNLVDGWHAQYVPESGRTTWPTPVLFIAVAGVLFVLARRRPKRP